jgi:hypothetical protein
MGKACSRNDQKFRMNNLIGGLGKNVNIILKWYIKTITGFEMDPSN